MLHIAQTSKTISSAAIDLEIVAMRNGFGVTQVNDLKKKFMEKKIELRDECKIVELYNTHNAAIVPSEPVRCSLAFPCKITLFQKDGKTMIATILPTSLLNMFPGDDSLNDLAFDLEKVLMKMIVETIER